MNYVLMIVTLPYRLRRTHAQHHVDVVGHHYAIPQLHIGMVLRYGYQTIINNFSKG